jgi:dinuclear metal center YbgI/SA1388 family protein
MAPVQTILEHLDALLRPERFDDYGPNGLQVPGRDDVETVVTGVSAHRELFERAIELGAGMVLVHHGLLWDKAPRRVTPTMAQRLRLLLEHEVNLVAYHLPLDAHPTIGNNALIAEGLGAGDLTRFGRHRGEAIGIAARFPDRGLDADELLRRVEALTKRPPLVFANGPDRINSIGIVSGGGAGNLAEAIDFGLDAFLTGEPAEPAMGEAREAGIHFVAAGHYATETFGVRRLGELLAERFGVRHEFVDIPNPV